MTKNSKDQYPIRFKPWRGKDYGQQNKCCRLLILGESHHGTPEENHDKNFTIGVIESSFNGEASPRTQLFFDRVLRLVTGCTGELDNSSREDFWNSVSFYNYVQEIVENDGEGNTTPRSETFRGSEEAFFACLKKVQPTHMLALGRRLWHRMPDYTRKTEEAEQKRIAKELGLEYWPGYYETCDNRRCLTINVMHPSARTSGYQDRWRPQVKAFLAKPES